jgi:hypothetical protein
MTALIIAGAQCGNSSAPAPTRTYRMGFSSAPPKLTVESVIATIEMWSTRGDAALLALTPPWKAMLADSAPRLIIRREQLDLVNYYRGKGMEIVAMVDATDGLARDKEHPDLIAAGRSITEPAIQAMYREYVMAVDSILHPNRLLLAMETNLVRALAPATVYDGLRVMVNDAATALTAAHSSATLGISVQVETAWGRLPGNGTYVGVGQDIADFPSTANLGLSSYPYLGGFSDPAEIPADYYSRIANESHKPVLVVEGGWSSVTVPGGAATSPEEQARYIARQMQLLDEADAVGVFQITFTDIDVSAWNLPGGSILPLFAYLGLVTADLQAKPALAEWDKAFARPR